MQPDPLPPSRPSIDERDPMRVKRNRILRLVQDLHAGSFMWLSDLLEAGQRAGLSAWETVRQLTKELDMAAVVSVEWIPAKTPIPRASDVLMTPVGDLHLPTVPGFSTRRTGKVQDRFKPFESDLLAGRDISMLEAVALTWESEQQQELFEKPEEGGRP